MKTKCNCYKEWETKCKCRSNWLECINNGLIVGENGYIVKDTCFNIYNDWVIYAETFKGYFGAEKNDEILLKFLKNNYEGNCCYENISLCLIQMIIKSYKVEDEEHLQQCIMSYLYWSYGLPYDENNILRRAFKNNDVDVLNYRYEPKDKKESNDIIVKNGYIRDVKVRELALQLANFQCEIDKEHDSFVSNVTIRNYVESHHFIPMKYYDEFQYSIDSEANIVALCPNCHRLLHHGRFEDKKILLERLYYKHIENLNKAGIEIELERLLEMYMN